MTQKIVRYFSDVHLGNAHAGLFRLASKEGINMKAIGSGEYVVFVNRAQTAFKMFAQGNVIAHYKNPANRRIDPKTIVELPRYFNGGAINYDAALKKVIEREFKK